MKNFRAAILDMDGVVTQTAKLHARAWKQMFDEFLTQRDRQTEGEQAAFDIEHDYRKFVDGKPRYDGVRSFLQSRGIDLPEGNAEASADMATVCGLGNRKNEIFLELLATGGVKVWDDAIEQVERWKRNGWKLAVFSSSRNCQRVLQAAGVWELFETKVDGNDLQRLGLRGKPSPDMLLRAAEQLGVEPSEAIAIEDAIAGIQAGRAGGFGMVVGVARDRSPKDLVEAGADLVISDLRELSSSVTAPNEVDQITRRLAGKRLALFLDYDGTLTPIVRRPEDATLSDSMRQLLSKLAQQHTVAIVSGRDLRDVQQMVGLDGLVYAGSHGFDIRGPHGLEMQQDQALQSLPQLDAAEEKLRKRVAAMTGARIERKKFAIAVHYREVEGPQAVKQIESVVDDVLDTHTGLRKRTGKKIFELQPDVEWDKGHAVLWLLQALGLQDTDVVVVYLGDDVTDEDAFAALRSRGLGIGIRVAESTSQTSADYVVRDCSEIQRLLSALACQEPGKHSHE